MEEEKIKLRSQEGQIFEIEGSTAFKSPVLKNMIEGFDGKEEIALEIRAAVLEKIIIYMEHYKDIDPPKIEKPFKSDRLEKILPAWEIDFINLEPEILLELINKADFLKQDPRSNLLNNEFILLIKRFFISITLKFHIKIYLLYKWVAITPLVELSGAKIAYLIDGKTAEELRSIFHIENNLTAELEAEFNEEIKGLEII